MTPVRSLSILTLLAAAASAQTLVFADQFDTSIPPQIAPGTASLTGVQGYLDLGPVGDRFGGMFLRSATGNRVTLSLTGLPAHHAISLEFLFAAIDSLDGTGTYPAGDFFKITLDGNTIFRESFANALASQVQSYQAAAGVTLARRVDLGFTGPGGPYTDSAYDLGADPIFANLAHTAANATFTFEIEGPGIQPISDESWAMDNLRVLVMTTPTASVARYGATCGPVLQAGALPRSGSNLPLSLAQLPLNVTLANCALGTSSATWGGSALPVPLDVLGMTRCWLLQDLSITSAIPMTLAGTTATLALPLPGAPALLGFQFFAQGWIHAPGVNPSGVQLSDGLRLVIGS